MYYDHIIRERGTQEGWLEWAAMFFNGTIKFMPSNLLRCSVF